MRRFRPIAKRALNQFNGAAEIGVVFHAQPYLLSERTLRPLGEVLLMELCRPAQKSS